MKAQEKKRYVTLAHIDEPELTYRNVNVPDIVPLFVNFESNKHVGSARLKQKENRIYAILEINLNLSDYKKMPAVALGVMNGKSLIENGIVYIEGGEVYCAGIVSDSIWEEVYGKTKEQNVELY